MSSVAPSPPASSRALVVEPDESVRRRVSAGLREQGMEVAECGDTVTGRELYCGQRLVVAPLNGSNEDMKAFVAWVRAEAGTAQPWIIALGTNHQPSPGETPGHYGVNDLLTVPMDTRELVHQLEAVGMGRLAENGAPPVKSSSPPSPGARAEQPPGPANGEFTAAGPPSYHRPAGIPSRSWRGASAAVLLENFPAAVAVLDRSLVFLAANQQWMTDFQLLGMPLPGMPLQDVFPNLHPDWMQLYQTCLSSGGTRQGEDVMQRADGCEGPVRWEVLVWRESNGLAGGLVLICAPVQLPELPASSRLEPATQAAAPAAEETSQPGLPSPEARQPENASGTAEASTAPETSPSHSLSSGEAAHSSIIDATFREMAEAAPFGMVLLGDEAQVLYANPQHGALLGCGIPEAGGMAEWLRRACPGEEDARRDALHDWWETVWTRHNPLTCSLRTTGGLVKDIIFRPVPLAGDRLLLTLSDVTDARLDEQAVRSSEARHRGLFQQSAAACAMMNAAGNVTDVNPAFEALTGFSKQEIRRASLGDFLPPAAVHRMRPAGGGVPGPFPTVITHRSGKTTPVIIAVSSLHNEQGAPIWTACTILPSPEKELSAEPPASAATSSYPASPVPALPLGAVSVIRTFSDTEWGGLTADLLFLLDEAGRVLDHNCSRDFQSFVPPEKQLHGQLLESAQPVLTAGLPLDDMIERLLDEPSHEVRCVFPAEWPGGAGQTRMIEARMVRVPARPARELESASCPASATEREQSQAAEWPAEDRVHRPAPRQFALSLRDLTAAGSASGAAADGDEVNSSPPADS